MNSNKNKSFLSRFFSHNITLLVLAFIIAFTAWFIISANSETEANVTIDKIPVNIDLTEEAVNSGLQVFNGDTITASVEVSGNRVVVGSLTASDISVSANQSSSIISPGTYTLALTAKKVGLKSNYNIVSSVTPPSISVFVDRAKEQEFTIDNRLSVEIDDSNHYASTSLSQNKVILSGPETMVNRIATVAVVDTVTPDDNKKQTVQEKLVYLDSNDNKLDLPLVVTDVETVEATIQVLPVKSFDLAVEISNAPSGAPSVSISPSSVKIAGPQETLDDLADKSGDWVIGKLDYSKLSNKKETQKFDLSLPTGCKIISGETTATATVDLSDYSKSEVTCKISSRLDATTYTAVYATNNIGVTVCGPEDLLSSISASDMTVIADFTGLLDNLKTGSSISLSVPLKISFSSAYSECWVSGSYTANVNVTKK